MNDISDPYLDLHLVKGPSFIWFWNYSEWRPIARKGQRCKVLAWGKKNTILVEFEDGFRVTTSRNAIRLEK